mmetsp:Transcript_14228/g.29275  ORF Transcript_14228/g.29275 Transcript_14228/m.29275 type:complete len:214 (+) Transcript_14228:498-1139(+)
MQTEILVQCLAIKSRSCAWTNVPEIMRNTASSFHSQQCTSTRFFHLLEHFRRVPLLLRRRLFPFLPIPQSRREFLVLPSPDPPLRFFHERVVLQRHRLRHLLLGLEVVRAHHRLDHLLLVLPPSEAEVVRRRRDDHGRGERDVSCEETGRAHPHPVQAHGRAGGDAPHEALSDAPTERIIPHGLPYTQGLGEKSRPGRCLRRSLGGRRRRRWR